MNLGKIKVWIEVASWYYGKVMQMITAFGVLKLLGFSWWVLLIILLSSIPVLIYVVYLHMKYVYPKEVEYTWNKNPAYKKLIKEE
jgi:hypothetical protein